MFVGYDIETASLDSEHPEYALQPWRVKEDLAKITLSCGYYKGKRRVETRNHFDILHDQQRLKKPVATWNGIFDLAFLYAAEQPIEDINWIDAMNLWKFLDNGQNMPLSWSLKAGAQRFLKDWPKLQEFLELKEEDLPDPSDPYWLERVSMDAEATALIAEIIWPQLTPQQQNLAKIQSVSLPMMAKSWVNGIRIDLDSVKKARPEVIQTMLKQEMKLGLIEPGSTIDNYVPSKILRSPDKLRKLLYDDYGLPCTRWTDGGKNGIQQKSTDKAALHYLSSYDDRILNILKWRSDNTMLSKFINGTLNAAKYLKSNILHPTPKVFGTYTGRLTYNSKIDKFPTGMSAHQIPRGKTIRQFMLPHDGHVIVELDSNSQEGRLMSMMSGDQQLKQLFWAKSPHDDMHSFMASRIAGESFDDFLERKTLKDPQAVIDRNAGKFTNFSYFYRSSPATARRIANVQYSLDADIATTTAWKKIFMQAYPMIPKYWKSAPRIAKAKGYAETLGGARYKITQWDQPDRVWGCESSAINYPIQGSGADMKYLALAVLVTAMPDLEDRFYLDWHDGLHFSIPKGYSVKFVKKMLRLLDEIDYLKYWGVNIDIPLTWEASAGWSEGTKFEINYDTEDNQTLDQFLKAVDND